MKAITDPVLVADAYLIHSLDLATRIAEVLGKCEDATRWKAEASGARLSNTYRKTDDWSRTRRQHTLLLSALNFSNHIRLLVLGIASLRL